MQFRVLDAEHLAVLPGGYPYLGTNSEVKKSEQFR
jgi:hypothetical protein